MKNLSWGIQWTTTLNDWEEGRMFYVVRSEREGISGRGVLATWHWLSREKVVVHPEVLRAVSDFESEWRWWWVHNCVIVGGRVWWLDQVTNQIHLYLHPLNFFPLFKQGGNSALPASHAPRNWTYTYLF
jgi:hypothetical protein